MELTLEAYSIIIEHVGNRSDIAILCRVSKAFRRAAEQTLYKAIHLEDPHEIRDLCISLANSPHLGSLVESFAISPPDEDDRSDDSDHGHGHVGPPAEVPEDLWVWVSRALERMHRLRYLDINSQIGGTSGTALSWIYPLSVFSLHTIRCDFDWDEALVTFLNEQHDLEDLYILDFHIRLTPPDTNTNELETTTTATTSATSEHPAPAAVLAATAMPKLATLECTFSEAAEVIAPHRPISHLKTCFSRTEAAAKREELERLFASLSLSTQSLQSLDIADSTYSEPFAMELLRTIVKTKITSTSLRYLGTLVLPVGGRERLQFYGLLMQLKFLQCIEVEVSAWDPVPSTPAAFRALASELRIYCPSIVMVVFVHDFERTLVTITQGIYTVHTDPYTEHLWREF